MVTVRPLRLALAVLLVLVALPAIWWRPVPQSARRGPTGLDIDLIERSRTDQSDGAISLAGVWRLSSANRGFGSYSALIMPAPGRLRAFGDSGEWVDFAAPGTAQAGDTAMFGSWRHGTSKMRNDVEAATYDSAGDRTWLALENINSIRRFDGDGAHFVEVFPLAMRNFPENEGVEAMTRLPDGRFLALRETADRLHPIFRQGLLFACDPVDCGEPLDFIYQPPAGYDPADVAALPDGRVVILLRGLTLAGFPPFASRLDVANPDEIRPGELWRGRLLADVSDLAPRENYEGLAVEPVPDGVDLWLISDSNNAVAMQRTLLTKLHWRGAAARAGVVPGGSSP